MSEIKQKQSLAYSIRKNIYRKLENVAEFNGLNVCDLIKNIINEFLAKDKQEQNKILFNDKVNMNLSASNKASLKGEKKVSIYDLDFICEIEKGKNELFPFSSRAKFVERILVSAVVT